MIDDQAFKIARYNDAVYSATKLEHEHLSLERELLSIKWYGYRFLTALAATKLFYEEYRKGLVHYLSVNKDRELAENTPIVPFEDFARDPAHLTSAWTARQRADAFCMPYELYIEFCMWFWARRSWGGRRYAPQINQLSYSDRSEVAWRAELEKFEKDRIGDAARSLADVPQLHAAVFMNTPEQLAARIFLINLCVASSRSWRDLIELWCYTFPILTTDCFKAMVDGEPLNSALLGAPIEAPTSPRLTLSVASFWPACHGLPTAQVMTEPTCAGCSFSGSCLKLAEMVQREVLQVTGSDAPRKAELRGPANARQAAYRARRKAAAGVVAPAVSFPGQSLTAPEAPPL